MGDQALRPNRQTALEIYTARGDIEAATLTKRGLGASAKEVSDFRKLLIREKTLEDSIEADF